MRGVVRESIYVDWPPVSSDREVPPLTSTHRGQWVPLRAAPATSLGVEFQSFSGRCTVDTEGLRFCCLSLIVTLLVSFFQKLT